MERDFKISDYRIIIFFFFSIILVRRFFNTYKYKQILIIYIKIYEILLLLLNKKVIYKRKLYKFYN